VKAPRAVAFTVAALAGFTLGWRIAGRHIKRHKSDLFSTSRIKRMAALSYLAGQDGPEAFQVLQDYVSWEPTTTLRRRAHRLMRQMRRNLE
jgi:hypothetical protein